MIEPMSLAALMAGANGLEIEVHIDPESALSDKDQQLTVPQFEKLMRKLDRAKAFLDSLDAEFTDKASGSGGGTDKTDDGSEAKIFADAVD